MHAQIQSDGNNQWIDVFPLNKIALMDRRECIVISDATSVQPLCPSHVDLSIIGLVAEAVEAEVAVGGVEEDLRNL